MTNQQKNYNFFQDLNQDIKRWFREPTFLMGSVSFLIVVVMIGGMLFWASHFVYSFKDRSSSETELEVAVSGLETIKRMVGDDSVWSETIQAEYNRIFPNKVQVSETSCASYDYGFISPDYSTNQILAK